MVIPPSESDDELSTTHSPESTTTEESPLPKLIDRSLKRLFRSHPQALLELAGLQASQIQFEDSTIHIPELYEEEITMLDEVEEFKELLIDLGVLQKWATDPRISNELVERGKTEGKLEGRVEGIEEGKLATVRQNTLTSISGRFGEVPPALAERIEKADFPTCERLFELSLTVASLKEIEEFII